MASRTIQQTNDLVQGLKWTVLTHGEGRKKSPGVAGNKDPGKIGLRSLGFPVNFDVTSHNFPGNYDRSVN